MIGWFRDSVSQDDIKPRAVSASLFTQAEAFGVGSSDSGTVEIPFDLLIDESHTLEFEASDHPIENGAVITDHVTQKLRTCTVTGLFTNHPVQKADELEDSSIDSYRDTEILGTWDGVLDHPRARDDMFKKLEELACERKPVRLVTSLKVYPEMIITSLPVKRDAKDGDCVKFTMTLREFKVATLKKTTAFGKFQPPDMKTAERRLASQKKSKGKVSAKGEKLVNAALSAGGF